MQNFPIYALLTDFSAPKPLHMHHSTYTKKYRALGIMSGSSLDGLDLAFCSFTIQKESPGKASIEQWELLQGQTLSFSREWKNRLSRLPKADARSIMQADVDFGQYAGRQVNHFLQQYQQEPDFIAFHGHTIFHDPARSLTVQIGDGAAVAAVTSYPVINQFRHQDVACGGQGAPIASIADKYLLSDYDFCLNLGGIANVTAQLPHTTVAFDICPANQLLNALAAQRGLEYDDEGQIAAAGRADAALLDELDQADYYLQDYPKTLDNFWGGQHILNKIEASSLSLPDKMRTALEHIVRQIIKSLENLIRKEPFPQKTLRLLPTGGGVFNTFFVKRLGEQLGQSLNIDMQIPDRAFAAFKEAVLMALMGVLRVENIPNVLHSVTGAERDTIGGAIHQGHKKRIGS